MAMPLDVRDLLRAGSEFVKSREEALVLHVLVELDAPEDLVEAARLALRPRTQGATVRVDAVSAEKPAPAHRDADAVIVLAGAMRSPIVSAMGEYQRLGMHTALVAVRPTDDPRAVEIQHPIDDTLVGPDIQELVDEQLAKWLADKAGMKRLALAHNFDFARKAVAEDAVRSTAWQNAVVGVVAFLPGADFPIMTANQAKMLLQIAAAYGESLGQDRIKELAVVVGGGFAFRAIARQVLGVVPGFGWVVKGGVAYSGTMAMGKAAVEYFERGADLSQVVTGLQQTAERYRRELKTTRRRGLRAARPDPEPVQAQLEIPPESEATLPDAR